MEEKGNTLVNICSSAGVRPIMMHLQKLGELRLVKKLLKNLFS